MCVKTISFCTWKALQEDGFGSRPFFYSFTAEAKGIEGEADSIVGYAIFFYTYSTWQGKSVFMVSNS